MKDIFVPGCALTLYKPELAKRTREYLETRFGNVDMLLTCCENTPSLPSDSRIITVCPGCDRTYRRDYDDVPVTSLWELIAESDDFPFPDYQSRKMSIIDACPTRDQDRIHNAIRAVVRRMGIEVIEPVSTRREATCCGDRFFYSLPRDKVELQMKKKASEMPLDEIIVYCVTCAKAMFIGKRRPNFLLDLLFSEETVPKILDLGEWHAEIERYSESHAEFEIAPR